MANSHKMSDSIGNIHFKETSFEYSIRPIYYFSRVFGSLPFSVVRGSDGRIQGPRVNTIDLLWFIVSICWYLALAIAVYRNPLLPQGSNASILMLGDNLMVVLGLTFGAVIIVMDMFNRTKLVAIFKRFSIFDQNVSQILNLNNIQI